MKRNGAFVAKHVTNYKERDIQPNGVDLYMDELYELFGSGARNKVSENDGGYDFGGCKVYIAKLANKVTIPPEHVGVFFQRSTMFRKYGLVITSALWDVGYCGYGEVLIHPTKHCWLSINERIGQITFDTAVD